MTSENSKGAPLRVTRLSASGAGGGPFSTAVKSVRWALLPGSNQESVSSLAMHTGRESQQMTAASRSTQCILGVVTDKGNKTVSRRKFVAGAATSTALLDGLR
jgi:hypothetical protein